MAVWKTVAKKLRFSSTVKSGIEGEASGHIPHPPADGFVVLHHIQAADRSRASVGKQQGGEDAEKRCLARTVRPNDAEKLTGSY